MKKFVQGKTYLATPNNEEEGEIEVMVLVTYRNRADPFMSVRRMDNYDHISCNIVKASGSEVASPQFGAGYSMCAAGRRHGSAFTSKSK